MFPAETRMMVSEPDDMRRFHVEVHGEWTQEGITRALGQLGRAESTQHAWISIEELIRVSGREHDEAWRTSFGGMVAFATSKGWTDPDGKVLRAHIVSAE
ncbi:hypothetical protein NWF34_14030 [Gordonia sp. GONU]|nr:hypothetical protein [Gordonia sp. GONU]